MALEKLMKDSEGPAMFSYEWALTGLKAENNPVSLEEDVMRSYAGSYGPRTIEYKDGQLYYQREGNPAYLMIPMTEHLFMFEDIPYFRLKVIKDGDHVEALMGLYDNGRTDRNARDIIRP